MTNIIYVPIIKTSEAEMRGVGNLLDSTKDFITPLFELTRSRASKNLERGDIFRRLEQLKDVFGEKRAFFLDLTSDLFNRNEQIDSLQDNRKGYKNWIDFLLDVKETFPGIMPVIQISDAGVSSESEFYGRIKQQVRVLDNEFGRIAYRFPMFNYDSFVKDLSEICSVIKSKKITVVVDGEFILRGMAEQYATKAIDILRQLKQFSLGPIVVAATSFPRNPTEYGDEETGEILLEEDELFDLLKGKVNSQLIYGDYATINPIRSPQAGGNGWVPRIDMPIKELIFYYRSRKSNVEKRYNPAYVRAAKRMVDDNRYTKTAKQIGDCWGIEQIEQAADGYPQGLSPSFWISVRMNVHITLRSAILA
jgi:hypothetical protein